MATLYGVNAAKRDNTHPPDRIDVQEQHGRRRVAYDEHTFDGNPSSGDVIKMMTLPVNAQILQATLVVHGALDAAATDIDVGWNGGTNGLETADEDGLFAAVDAGTGALVKKLLADAATSAPLDGYSKRFDDEVTIEISLDAALDGADGDKISLEIEYVLD